jgi:hypothetical protein
MEGAEGLDVLPFPLKVEREERVGSLSLSLEEREEVKRERKDILRAEKGKRRGEGEEGELREIHGSQYSSEDGQDVLCRRRTGVG